MQQELRSPSSPLFSAGRGLNILALSYRAIKYEGDVSTSAFAINLSSRCMARKQQRALTRWLLLIFAKIPRMKLEATNLLILRLEFQRQRRPPFSFLSVQHFLLFCKQKTSVIIIFNIGHHTFKTQVKWHSKLLTSCII